MSKNIPLQHGLFALVDDDDFERCAQFKWYVGSRGYVRRKFYGPSSITLLSRFIMNDPKGVQVDHIHGNLLDNRKSELRVGTNQQNNCNKGKCKNNKSGFKGVSWHKQGSKWMAKITVHRKQIYLGSFTDILEAVAAYAAAAKKYHGEFARTSW